MDACEATKALVAYYNEPLTHPTLSAVQNRCANLEAHLARVVDRLMSMTWRCADQEKTIAGLREALDLSSETIRSLRAQLPPVPQEKDSGADDALWRAIRSFS